MFGTFNLYEVSFWKLLKSEDKKTDEERMKKFLENCFYLSDCL